MYETENQTMLLKHSNKLVSLIADFEANFSFALFTDCGDPRMGATGDHIKKARDKVEEIKESIKVEIGQIRSLNQNSTMVSDEIEEIARNILDHHNNLETLENSEIIDSIQAMKRKADRVLWLASEKVL